MPPPHPTAQDVSQRLFADQCYFDLEGGVFSYGGKTKGSRMAQLVSAHAQAVMYDGGAPGHAGGHEPAVQRAAQRLPAGEPGLSAQRGGGHAHGPLLRDAGGGLRRPAGGNLVSLGRGVPRLHPHGGPGRDELRPVALPPQGQPVACRPVHTACHPGMQYCPEYPVAVDAPGKRRAGHFPGPGGEKPGAIPRECGAAVPDHEAHPPHAHVLTQV